MCRRRSIRGPNCAACGRCWRTCRSTRRGRQRPDRSTLSPSCAGDDAHGDGVECAADLQVPTLVIGNRADDACTPSHTQRLYDAVGHLDKTLHIVQGATHYYAGKDQRGPLGEAVSTITIWLTERGFATR